MSNTTGVGPEIPTEGPVDKGIGAQVPDVPGYGPGTEFNANAPAPMSQVGSDSHPQYPGQEGPPLGSDEQIFTEAGVTSDVGNDDQINPTVESATSEAMARREELESDTHPVGGVIGDLMDLPVYHQDQAGGKMEAGDEGYQQNINPYPKG